MMGRNEEKKIVEVVKEDENMIVMVMIKFRRRRRVGEITKHKGGHFT